MVVNDRLFTLCKIITAHLKNLRLLILTQLPYHHTGAQYYHLMSSYDNKYNTSWDIREMNTLSDNSCVTLLEIFKLSL